MKSLEITSFTFNYKEILLMQGVALMWLFCSIILNVNASRMQAGDVYNARHIRTLLKKTGLLARAKNVA